MESKMEFSEEQDEPTIVKPVHIFNFISREMKKQCAQSSLEEDVQTRNSSVPFTEEQIFQREVTAKILKEKLEAMRHRVADMSRDVSSFRLSGPHVFAHSSHRPQCSCGSNVKHEFLLESVCKLLKIFNTKKDLQEFLMKRRLGEEAAATKEEAAATEEEAAATEEEKANNEAEMKTQYLLRGLLKRVLMGFRFLDFSDSKSVLGSQQAINRLKQNGFKAEYSLLQHLHNAKVSNKSSACSDEITKMFEKCHL